MRRRKRRRGGGREGEMRRRGDEEEEEEEEEKQASQLRPVQCKCKCYALFRAVTFIPCTQLTLKICCAMLL
jgi:hypothetical protein